MKPGDAGPRHVGRYALFDAIAAGGMASVHFGRLMGPVGFARTVAIKRLHENYATDPEFVAMFMDEARLAARVRHPNVVPTLDVVALDHEVLLVMEYIAGESLSHLLKRARTAGTQAPIPVVVDIVINALSGLHAAHEAVDEVGHPIDIVHRDVSPQNILVGTDGVARVLDFGVAKAIGRAHQTRVGQVKGKLRYMSPEQVRGESVTRSADIYAASIVLWEALTGQRLFDGDSDATVMYRVMEGRPEPPSHIRSDVPRALDDIVVRGLSPNAADRFPTAQAMASALEKAIAPVARSTVAAWVVENAGDAIKRRKERLAYIESTGTHSTQSPQAAAQAVTGLMAAAPSRETPDGVSSLTPPSVEQSSESFHNFRPVWGPKRAMLVGAAMALVVGFLPSMLLSRSSSPRDATMAFAPPPLVTALPSAETHVDPIAPRADAGVTSEARAPATGTRATTAPPPPLPQHAAPSQESPRKALPPSPPLAKPAAPKSAPAERLYQRD